MRRTKDKNEPMEYVLEYVAILVMALIIIFFLISFFGCSVTLKKPVSINIERTRGTIESAKTDIDTAHDITTDNKIKPTLKKASSKLKSVINEDIPVIESQVDVMQERIEEEDNGFRDKLLSILGYTFWIGLGAVALSIYIRYQTAINNAICRTLGAVGAGCMGGSALLMYNINLLTPVAWGFGVLLCLYLVAESIPIIIKIKKGYYNVTRL